MKTWLVGSGIPRRTSCASCGAQTSWLLSSEESRQHRIGRRAHFRQGDREQPLDLHRVRTLIDDADTDDRQAPRLGIGGWLFGWLAEPGRTDADDLAINEAGAVAALAVQRRSNIR